MPCILFVTFVCNIGTCMKLDGVISPNTVIFTYNLCPAGRRELSFSTRSAKINVKCRSWMIYGRSASVRWNIPYLECHEEENLKIEVKVATLTSWRHRWRPPDRDRHYGYHCFVCGSMFFITARAGAAAWILYDTLRAYLPSLFASHTLKGDRSAVLFFDALALLLVPAFECYDCSSHITAKKVKGVTIFWI